MRPAEGPAEIQVTPRISLKLPRTLAFLPAADGLKLMHALGERPGAEVLGVVVTRAEGTPRMMIIFAKARDAQGVSDVELVGWDEVPAIRSLIQEILLAQERM
jgi:uncharacterized membrane-anchored protein